MKKLFYLYPIRQAENWAKSLFLILRFYNQSLSSIFAVSYFPQSEELSSSELKLL